jgi:peroxiredoxin
MRTTTIILIVFALIASSCGRATKKQSETTNNSDFQQETVVKKPERVIIVNDEIITMEQLLEYEALGRLKVMHNGVSDERRAELFEKFGDKIGPKEFIFDIYLHADVEIDTQYDNEPAIKINDSIRDFTVKMIDGTLIKLSDLKGNVVLINFWATWCAPCIREFYEFPSMIQPFKNSKFVLLPISRGETEEEVKKKMAQLRQDGINFNVGIDPRQSIAGMYGAKEAIPKNVLIDKNGIVRYISTGFTEENINNISTLIEKLLGE